MDAWTVIRFLHIGALAFFIGGQLVLVAPVVPALRRHGNDPAMRSVARRFGIGTAAALVVLLATGAAMGDHFARWHDPTLQAKLAVLVLVAVLTGLHVATPQSRALSFALVLASLVVVWLGVKLTHG